MTQRLRVPPTKSVLLRLQREAKFLEQGCNLLERKRELLTRLVYGRLASYREEKARTEVVLKVAYRQLTTTQLRMGSRALGQAGLGLAAAVTVKILPRSSLGVEYPAVSAERLPLQPVSLLWSDASFDETRNRLAELAVVLARLAEAETVLRRLLNEQRKTRKRVNALKYNVIPRYQNTIRIIESSLEEEERNTLFQIKLLSEREVKEVRAAK